MAITARVTIQGALKLIGVLDPIETMSAEDGADGLVMLNNIVDTMNIEDLNLYSIVNVTGTFTGSTATIGAAQTFDTPRPIRIKSAFYRDGTIDYPIEIITEAKYNSLALKTVTGAFPEVLYYDAFAPTGNIYVYPVSPSNTYYLQVMSQLVAFADLDTSYDLPQGYNKYLMYTLAEELAPLYRLEPPPSVRNIGVKTRRTVRRGNVKVNELSLGINAKPKRNIFSG